MASVPVTASAFLLDGVLTTYAEELPLDLLLALNGEIPGNLALNLALFLAVDFRTLVCRRLDIFGVGFCFFIERFFLLYSWSFEYKRASTAGSDATDPTYLSEVGSLSTLCFTGVFTICFDKSSSLFHTHRYIFKSKGEV